MQKFRCVDVSQGAQGVFSAFEKVLDRRHGKVFAKGVGRSPGCSPDALEAACFMVLTQSHGTRVQAPGREAIALRRLSELVVF
ncbi:hypothetical protein HNP46_002250 [Pseudomonas nitritireducens]|uniref:Uncharacterized protein n=1 Tax=Pseudomonas nitroreducens TaxID=46680 RepID=A0A7W7KJT9_PSENT|nr:hypothetical protein [Pseudomonas nitritireducens]MBB4863403.1 hypothetical protein [Pseudomonas nitritireducens]